MIGRALSAVLALDGRRKAKAAGRADPQHAFGGAKGKVKRGKFCVKVLMESEGFSLWN